MTKKLVTATLVVLLFGLIWIKLNPVAVFPGIAGPTKASVIKDQKPMSVEDFSTDLPSSLAVLLTDPDSNWLSLAHAMESFGIPSAFTKDTTEALKHNVVIVYPRLSGRVLSRESLQSIRSFVHGGGTLMAVNVLGGGLNAVFGFKDAFPSRDRYQVAFLQRVSTLLPLDGTRETVFQLGHPDKGEPIGSHGYTFPSAPPLACFEDGTGAIIGRDFERGHAYAFGFDIGQLIHKEPAHKLKIDQNKLQNCRSNILNLVNVL
ncbi:hypothetical protein D1AOALGA4SA_1557 [Olavius algarvensis Delta 1 endosymbiont]|nr:hypothetical protein D1AOALGA4SA_1557 [Olavius algarvensis Delta 1 endosymbiont]